MQIYGKSGGGESSVEGRRNGCEATAGPATSRARRGDPAKRQTMTESPRGRHGFREEVASKWEKAKMGKLKPGCWAGQAEDQEYFEPYERSNRAEP